MTNDLPSFVYLFMIYELFPSSDLQKTNYQCPGACSSLLDWKLEKTKEQITWNNNEYVCYFKLGGGSKNVNTLKISMLYLISYYLWVTKKIKLTLNMYLSNWYEALLTTLT